MRNDEVYAITIQKIKNYFGDDRAEELFLHGGCYWLADYLHRQMELSFIMFNKEKEHCAIEFCHELYDITGRISSQKYQPATERNINYMRKYYIPSFDVQQVERYLLLEKSSRAIDK